MSRHPRKRIVANDEVMNKGVHGVGGDQKTQSPCTGPMQGKQYCFNGRIMGINGGTCPQNKVNERPRVSIALKPTVG